MTFYRLSSVGNHSTINSSNSSYSTLEAKTKYTKNKSITK